MLVRFQPPELARCLLSRWCNSMAESPPFKREVVGSTPTAGSRCSRCSSLVEFRVETVEELVRFQPPGLLVMRSRGQWLPAWLPTRSSGFESRRTHCPRPIAGAYTRCPMVGRQFGYWKYRFDSGRSITTLLELARTFRELDQVEWSRALEARERRFDSCIPDSRSRWCGSPPLDRNAHPAPGFPSRDGTTGKSGILRSPLSA